MIRNVPYFKNLPLVVLQDLVYLLKPKRYNPDTLVVKRGQSSDCVFFLKSGEIHIEQPLIGGIPMHFDTLNAGSCFSIYDAFHEDMKQSYDFRTKTFCMIESIDAADIIRLEKVHNELADMLQKLRI